MRSKPPPLDLQPSSSASETHRSGPWSGDSSSNNKARSSTAHVVNCFCAAISVSCFYARLVLRSCASHRSPLTVHAAGAPNLSLVTHAFLHFVRRTCQGIGLSVLITGLAAAPGDRSRTLLDQLERRYPVKTKFAGPTIVAAICLAS